MCEFPSQTLFVCNASWEVVKGSIMAAHPLTILLLRVSVDTLLEWADVLWATTIDVLFIVLGCMKRSVIFDIRFRMLLPEGDPVLLIDPVVGWMLRCEGVE